MLELRIKLVAQVIVEIKSSLHSLDSHGEMRVGGAARSTKLLRKLGADHSPAGIDPRSLQNGGIF